MSGELQVVFIYDTKKVQKEEDDPASAILYFHPPEIPVQRRVAICGQLMGVTQFLLHTFTAPKVLTLENGKFAMKEFGRRYVLALGCSSVTPDWLLEKQADILFEITRFFHKDIDHALQEEDKLTSIMDHYIPISQHHGDLFALSFEILPILNLPKSAGHISLSASVVLQTCLLSQGVLGGVVMFQSKVLGVELPQDLARKLAFIQPYQLPPAELLKPSGFSLPPGVQLLKVYLNQKQLGDIRDFIRKFKDKIKGTNRNRLHSETDDNDEPTITSSKSQISSEESSSSNTHTGTGSTRSTSSSSSGVESQSQTQTSPAATLLSSSSSVTTHQSPKPLARYNHNQLSLFQSMGNLTTPYSSSEEEGEEEENEKSLNKKPLLLNKHYSTSLTDPFFPYVRYDGKPISKFWGEEQQEENENDVTPSSHTLIQGGFPVQENKDLKKSAIKVQTTPEENSQEQEKENKEPEVPHQPSSKPTLNLNRPKDLALNTAPSRRKSRRRWSTFEDMMSPLMENDNPIPNPTGPQEEVESTLISSQEGNPKLKSTSLLLSSFRRVSGGSASSPDYGGSDCTNTSGRGSDCKDNRYALSSPTTDQWKLPGYSYSWTKPLSNDPGVMEDVVLFIYTLGGMRLMLLMEKGCGNDKELIQTLREYGASSLSNLETEVCNVEEQSMSMGTGHHQEHYCYLHYDPIWKSLEHGGRNHNMDFEVVQHMHQHFHVYPRISEVIVRGDDHVVYGYHCAGSEVFYQQSAGLQPGLPMPSDLMGKLPLKARRRLERDHGILML